MSIRANGTAVYLGNGWVLTANHTTGGDMTFNGQTFSEVPGTEQWISTGSGDVLTTWATFDFADGTSEAQAVAGDSGGPVFAKRVRPPQPHLNPLIASAGGPFPSATEAMHGTWRGSKEAGRVAAAAIAI